MQKWRTTHSAIEPTGKEKGCDRDDNPEQQPGGKIDPKTAHSSASGDPRSSLRVNRFNTSAVTRMVTTVLTTSATMMISHSAAINSACTIRPTPAGTNNNAR